MVFDVCCLYTKKWRQLARYLGFEFIDHLPAIGDDLAVLKFPFADMIQRYQKHFGKPDLAIWNEQCCKGCSCHTSTGVMQV